MTGGVDRRVRARRVPAALALASVLIAVVLSACTAGSAHVAATVASSSRNSESVSASASVTVGGPNECEPVAWTGHGDHHAPGSLTGALQGRANPSLAIVSIDGETLHLEQVLVDHSDGRLQAGTSFALYALHPDGRGTDWWQSALARNEPTPAILVVPDPPQNDSLLLATLTWDFAIDQPCVYEADRQRAADVLGLAQRDLIEELLRRGDAAEPMPGQEL